MALRPQQMKTGRKIRRPQHTWNIEFRPWEITQHMVAPVLAGETLRSALFQARTVTDPIDMPLIGWWSEHYMFFVPLRMHTDNSGGGTAPGTAYKNMLLDPSTSLSGDGLSSAGSTSSYISGANKPRYHFSGYMKIVGDWFRQDGEEASITYTNGRAQASVNQRSWLDSVVSDTNYLANVAPDQTLTIGGDGSFTMKELEDLQLKYEYERRLGFHKGEDGVLEFEDWLEFHGVRPRPEWDERTEKGRNRCELIRYWKSWQYPSNTIDPSTGTPSSAVMWSTRGRADKDRFFSEPGTLHMVTVVRPKVYFSKQAGGAMEVMTEARHWLPDVLSGDPSFSYTKISALSGPLTNSTDAYWVDVRDLFMYGDQYVNFALTETDSGLVALPSAALAKRYPASTDADNLFKTKTAGTGKIREDGVVTMMIASSVHQDTSATI